MKLGFYARLAASGIRKNRRLFTPFILTCCGMAMMLYIVSYLALSPVLDSIRGAEILRSIFSLGSFVIAVFAAIFLFYTNSFLIRQRKKEFGLYNILGMGKRNLSRILFWETLLEAGLAIVLGLGAGVAFSKLAELGLVNLLGGEVTYSLSVCVPALLRGVEVFGLIFLLLFLNGVHELRRSSAIALLRSENVGERIPRFNALYGILGMGLLAAAYYLAVSIQDPVAALVTFFYAVIMVICGTYLVMISGSVLFCQLLQRNKGYYYKPNHFVSVSSMVYRMKRNGAGLASICILATMVLVMVSSTTCLYFGHEDAIKSRYPREINLSLEVDGGQDLSPENFAAMRAGLEEQLLSLGVTAQNDYGFRVAYGFGLLQGENMDLSGEGSNAAQVAMEMRLLNLVPLEDYNRLLGASETLAPGEALIYCNRGDFKGENLRFGDAASFRIKKQVDTFVDSGESAMDMATSITLIVPDLQDSLQRLETVETSMGLPGLRFEYSYHFDTGLDKTQHPAFYEQLRERLVDDGTKAALGYHTCALSCQTIERDDFLSMFGALFYIGLILSLVFITAAVLIIYYKQLSEGYEDQARFEIMQKVGMTKREIRRSINSQLLTVFFLPLIFAALHLCFAFPIISRLLLLFNLNNVPLFAATTAISLGVFALFYMAVYRVTSNTYYKIVSGLSHER